MICLSCACASTQESSASPKKVSTSKRADSTQSADLPTALLETGTFVGPGKDPVWLAIAPGSAPKSLWVETDTALLAVRVEKKTLIPMSPKAWDAFEDKPDINVLGIQIVNPTTLKVQQIGKSPSIVTLTKINTEDVLDPISIANRGRPFYPLGRIDTEGARLLVLTKLHRDGKAFREHPIFKVKNDFSRYLELEPEALKKKLLKEVTEIREDYDHLSDLADPDVVDARKLLDRF